MFFKVKKNVFWRFPYQSGNLINFIFNKIFEHKQGLRGLRKSIFWGWIDWSVHNPKRKPEMSICIFSKRHKFRVESHLREKKLIPSKRLIKSHFMFGILRKNFLKTNVLGRCLIFRVLVLDKNIMK